MDAELTLRCVCFDFDGTLVDSMDAAFNAYCKVGPGLGCPAWSRAEFQALRGLHVREVIRRMGLPLYRVPRLARRMRASMLDDLLATPPVPGIAEALTALAEAGLECGVLTSNATATVHAYIARHRLLEPGFVVGGARLLAKQRPLRRLLRQRRLVGHELIYVGDELRDIEAARRAGVWVGAVGWGYTEARALAAARPDRLFAHPAELCRLLHTDGSAGQAGVYSQTPEQAVTRG